MPNSLMGPHCFAMTLISRVFCPFLRLFSHQINGKVEKFMCESRDSEVPILMSGAFVFAVG